MEKSVKNHADAMIFHTLVVPQAAQHSPMADVKSHSCFYVAISSGKKRLRNGEWNSMKERLKEIKERALAQINESDSLERLGEIKVALLGKKGELTEVLKGMKDVAPEDRPQVGQIVNETRQSIEEMLENARKELARKKREFQLQQEVIDVTLPAKKNNVGHRHPNTIALEEVERIFIGMGYEVVEGPEVEYDYYNFEALNIPANHPAKDEQDTFYIDDKILLRTQTSPVQVRQMERGHLPIRMIAPGRVFRADEVDATHSPSFHQIEGMVIDKGITFADLKGTLQEFAKELFGPDTKVKFRPHHFPFTEPSAEVDVTCFKCGGKGCRFCKGEGWIEILGCGMMHPKVLKMSGIDPDEYSGFAFGVGLERIALLKYEIDDMRLLYENDARFLKQF
jgi:phenylalanyl-tRNA synthetase alpha chain